MYTSPSIVPVGGLVATTLAGVGKPPSSDTDIYSSAVPGQTLFGTLAPYTPPTLLSGS